MKLLIPELQNGEWCGTAEEALTQQLLAQGGPWLRTQPGLVSQGRTLLALDPHISAKRLDSLVKKFKRVLVYGSLETLPETSERLRRSGFVVDSALSLLDGDRSKALLMLSQIDRRAALPPGWSFDEVGVSASAEQVKAIQRLHQVTGITALPGYFIRGVGAEARTVVLYDDRREIAGCATSLNLDSAGGSFKGAAMVLGVCLAPRVRGRGLSLHLNRAALSYGLNHFEATRVCEIVEEGNIPSFRMNAACGLSPHPTHGFIFTSFRAC